MDGTSGGAMTEREVALVLRRAAEIDRPGPALPAVLDEAAVEQAALEAGISRAAVRQAVAELRAGVLSPAPTRRPGLLSPPVLVVGRLLTVPRAVAEARLHEFLQVEHFEALRRMGDRTCWVRSASLAARVHRLVDRGVQRRLVLREVRRVDLAVVDDGIGAGGEGEPTRTLVALEIDVRPWRQGHARLLGAGTAVGTGLAGVALALGGIDPLTLAATGAGGGIAAGGQAAGRAYYRSRVSAIEMAVEGVLDGLEHGHGSLPPGAHRDEPRDHRAGR